MTCILPATLSYSPSWMGDKSACNPTSYLGACFSKPVLNYMYTCAGWWHTCMRKDIQYVYMKSDIYRLFWLHDWVCLLDANTSSLVCVCKDMQDSCNFIMFKKQVSALGNWDCYCMHHTSSDKYFNQEFRPNHVSNSQSHMCVYSYAGPVVPKMYKPLAPFSCSCMWLVVGHVILVLLGYWYHIWRTVGARLLFLGHVILHLEASYVHVSF